MNYRLASIQFAARLFALLAAMAFLQTASFTTLSAQSDEDKRPLTHEDYEKWNSVRGQNISDDGKWISYTLSTEKGDGTLYIRHIATDKQYTILRGRSARFTFDSKHILFVVAPDSKAIEKHQKEKKPASMFPKSKLQILNLETGKHVTVSGVNGFTMPAKATGWVAFTMQDSSDAGAVKQTKSSLTTTYEITEEGVRRQEENKKKAAKKKAAEEKAKQAKGAKKKPGSKETKEKKNETAAESKNDAKKAAKKKEKRNGSTLVLRNLNTFIEQRFPFATNYRFSEDGQQFAFATSTEDGEGDGVHVVDLKKLETKRIVSTKGNYSQVVFSKDGKQLAFLTDADDYAADKPEWAMYHWKRGAKAAKKVVDHKSKGIPEGWQLASTAAPVFTENGKRLLFNTRPIPEPEETEDEKKKNEEKPEGAKLDIWHWQDPFLQPQQLLQAAAERNRSYRALYNISGRKVIQVATKEIPSVRIDPRSESNVAFGVSPDKYNKMRSWDVQGYSDWHLIDLKTGKARKLAEMKRGFPSLSPSGKFLTWWDGEKQTWFALSTKTPKKDEKPAAVDIGKAIGEALFNELHDTPSLPGPYGTAGWTTDDKSLLIYDRWDIWKVDPAGKEQPVCLTNGEGREKQVRYRAVRLDFEQRFVDLDQALVLSTFIHETKASGYSRWSANKKDSETDYQVEQLIVLDESVGGLRKARNTDAVMFTRSTFQRSPDVWASTLDFKTTRRISHMNPQQSDYIWGTAELVEWNAKDGQQLDGILYKPENFDPTKKYPLMVYFYERNSDNLHRYYTPAAGRSIINFSFYASRGYVIFVPDIPYKTGEPGPSAANAILPGVDSIVEKGFIDKERIGMQGHSWGGYQTAYLVTMTDMFCCAESGAPVSNMTSAYGGIRWGTGMSRMFQYEKTQSRIGGTLWEARDKYIANSPVFFADKINTPLLILHNDQDTAVPWYQGIELFVAMRRLEKPSWMLNYNGDPHWVMTDEGRLDFAKRMQQFFDHYMKGDPMPVWMAKGVPAVDKGKEYGFEYAEEEETESTKGSAEGEKKEAK